MTTALDRERDTAADPIAIIGIGCRFPGGANDPESFWKLLCDGVDAVREIPPDRWSIRKFYHPDPSKPGKTYSRWGGFLEGIDLFDAAFFRISAREAAFMDPQHRLLLEVAWEALEDGGQVVGGEAGSDAGVFVGISSQDYSYLQSSILDQSRTSAHTNAGMAMSIAANRISHCLNLRGPSLAVDTACSSALVAVHLACRSLRNQECTTALAGGVNLLLRAEPFIGFSKAAMLSSDGRCRSFSAGANGYVRAEGAGMILLKPLPAAMGDGDPIYAVIRGTAVNEDGHTQGLSLPSGRAQEALVRAACRDAGVSPGRVRYVEAHGTGTAVGDPIEANALGAALSLDREAGDYCWMGSVKTNLGHLESAAGMPGIIKAALVLKNRVVPPNLHFESPNPNIDFEQLQLRVPTALESLDSNEQGVFAGVNSFGFGGANAHVVLESPPRVKKVEGNGKQKLPAFVLLPLSADGLQALQAAAHGYAEFLGPNGRGGPLRVEDVCYTASQRRHHHAHRLSVVGRSHEELVAGLGKFLTATNGASRSSEKRTAERKPKVAFVFGGQGPQWWGMGRALLGEEAVFREKIAECSELLRSLGQDNGRTLWEEFHVCESESRMHEIATAHWTIFSLQVATAALWRSWGIEPDVVAGHSIGEIAAAHVAGALSLSDAALVIFHRGRCLEKLHVTGKMLAVGLSRQEAMDLVAQRGDGIWMAAINSPTSVTLSGDAEALAAIARDLQQRQVFCKFLQVSFPYHSAYLDSMKEEFREALCSLAPQRAAVPMISTVTGNPAEGPELDAGYWWLNARRPVQFASAMSAMFDLKADVFVEISPHPVLATSIHECLRSERREATVLTSLRRGEPERAVMLASLGALYTQGVPVRWPALFPNGGECVRLPVYPWQRERYWHEALDCRDARLNAPIHPLLSRDLGSVQPGWEVKLDTRLLPWIKDHQVRGRAVFPAAGYVEMALAAAGQILGDVPCVLEEIEIHKPLFVQDGDQAPTLQLTYEPQDGSFRIHSRVESSKQPWTLHCLGKIRPESGNSSRGNGTLLAGTPEDLWNRLDEEIPSDEYYRSRLPTGLHYGPSFQGLQRIRWTDGEALAEIVAPAALHEELDDYRLHPVLLDSCFQLFPLTLPSFDDARAGPAPLYLPVRIESVRFQGWPGGRAWGQIRLSHCDSRSLEADIRVLDNTGRPWIELKGFRCQPVGEVKANDGHGDCLYRWEWQLKPLPDHQPVRRPADFLPNTVELGQRLQAEAARLGSLLGWDQSWQGEVDGLCIAYIVRAIEKHVGRMRVGDRVTVEALRQKMGVVPAHERLLERYLTMLEEEGLLRRCDVESDEALTSWEVTRLPEPVDIEQLWRALPFELSDLQPELTLIERCGRNLSAVLRGEADPLELLMPGGSLATLEHVYDSSRSSRIQNISLQKAVTAAVERMPEGRTLRILEIGAGTGGVAAHVLPRLPVDRVEYVFTDVSAFFLSKAEQRFAAFPFVQYQLLDIEKPPKEQGFDEHGFDLVIAANTLHATTDLGRTLAHVQQVLAPDGWLILMELTKPLRWLDLVFGLMEGWWKFADRDLRPSHPLLALNQWHTLLAQAGFRDVASISDPAGAVECELAVILARGPALRADWHPKGALEKANGSNADEPMPFPARDAGGWLLFADGGGVARQLLALLEQSGEQCTMLTSEEDLGAALDRSGAPFGGIIHLWSLDVPTGRNSAVELDEAQERGCHSVMRLVQALAKRGQSPQLWLVTRGAQPAGEPFREVNVAQAPLIGLGRVILNEHPHLRCRMVDLPAAASGTDVADVRALALELTSNDGEEEVALRGEARYVPRLLHASLQGLCRAGSQCATSDRFTLESTAAGMLENLVLRQQKRQVPAAGEVEIEVCAAGLNFRDVMKALGIYPTESGDANSFGDECAGRIVAVGKGVTRFRPGDEVLALCVSGLGSHVTTPEFMACHKPRHLSFEQAATIPIVFLTAEYALHHIGRIRAGERVLIHAAAGGVGLAALQIARLAGAEVFATAGSREKRAFLRSLGIEHVMDSRGLDFSAQVKEATGGEGVDIVLNSLAGPAITAGLSCLREYGRFLEIGKRDIFGHTRVDLHPFRNNLSFAAIDLASTLKRRPDFVGSMMRDVVGQFERGALHPLPHRTFPISDIVPAMRHMAQARHTGKVVLSIQDQKVTQEPAREVAEESRFESGATYLITGGLGGVGLAVAQWMVDQGARHLVLMGRSGATSEEARQIIAAMEEKGARVIVAQADVAKEADVARVLAMINASLPPLRGVMHGAMVLDDGVLTQLDATRFRKVTDPKMLGAWNLHVQTLATPLDFFVMFSSTMCLLGNPGQGNYGAANSFLDRLAHHRRALGLPALTINWGRLGDVGYVARHEQLGDQWSRMGVEALPMERATEILGQLLRKKPTQIAAQLMDWPKLAQRFPAIKSSPKFSHLVAEDQLNPSAECPQNVTRDAILAASVGDRQELVEAHLREAIGKVVGAPASKIGLDRPLSELGMDSLMTIELTNRLEADLGLTISTGTVLGGQNVSRLAEALVGLLENAGDNAASQLVNAG